MLRWLYAVAVEAVLTLFAFLLLTGRYINDGPVVVSVTDDQGLHAGDFVIIAAWLVATAAVVLLVTSWRRPRSS